MSGVGSGDICDIGPEPAAGVGAVDACVEE
jgi:hypothetical protein